MTSAAEWWSYAEGNAAVLGFVVSLVAVAALLFVGRRIVEQRKRRRR
jgi:hypothetical protein